MNVLNEYSSRNLIERITPHKGKMLLLNRVLSIDLDKISIETEIDINENCMFFCNDSSVLGVPSYVAFEYMAQSISALYGIYAKKMNKPIKMGFIMSISNCNASIAAFKSGDIVTVKVSEVLRVDKTVTFEGCAYVNSTLALTASLCALETDNI